MTNPASLAQLQAADPAASTWLSANAGSGKTRVLTDRVARLLLRGVEPENILCLTYTKAAASEMQNRLFQRLGAWAMLNEGDLLDALESIGETAVRDPTRARTLFARAIETPGGLKIQTIHSFCTGLLRRFPLEAGVTPNFRALEDAELKSLVGEVLDELARAGDASLTRVLENFTGEDPVDLALAVAGRRDAFSTPAANLTSVFDLPADFCIDLCVEMALGSGGRSLCETAVPILSTGSKTDQKIAETLSRLPAQDGPDALATLEAALLTKAGDIPKRLPPTKPLRTGAFMPFVDAFEDLIRRVADARDLRRRLLASEATAALHDFAGVFLSEFDRLKTERGVLDFDDLILKTRALLTDPAVAQWVLWRLDGGIDHILVDEAQDTSPSQWSVIMALAEEMSAGTGARGDVERTIFVVGDKKQSIYSFQGADPSAFDAMAAATEQRLSTRRGLKRRSLEYSFRSAPAILRAVDHVFDGDMRDGLGLDFRHRAFHEAKPGRVDLWPLTELDDAAPDPAWYDPVDRTAAGDPNVRLAQQIAAEIARMMAESTLDTGDGPRRVRPGDILILVAGRSELFHQIIRACKSADLPVAGADRLKVAGVLAVRDVMALLSFLALPEDDLSLAAALRSPLFGWTENDLFELAHGRTGYLWAALRDASAHAPTSEVLRDLRRQADFLRPYELIERILIGMDGRRKLLARLGPEAEDGLDELLNQSLSYEARAIPTLAGFVAHMQAGDVDVKRQADGSGDLIRVMTVHGAKGLEAPVVILPDTMRVDSAPRGFSLLSGPEGIPLWPMASAERDTITGAAAEARANRDREERRRLLYVAMTRAENWLVVCGTEKKNSTDSAWYEAICNGLSRAGAIPFGFAEGRGLRLETGNWSALPSSTSQSAPTASVTPPAFGPVPPRPPTIATLSPSDLGGEKTMPGGHADPDATTRGTAIHRMLELMPEISPERRASVGAAILAENGLDDMAILEEAMRVLEDPATSACFESGALTEVPVVTTGLTQNARFDGTIDRLVVGDRRVQAIDFKTNREIPKETDDVPESLLRQMGAYLHQLSQIFPDHEIELVLLWTAGPSAMVLPHGIVRAALSRATKS